VYLRGIVVFRFLSLALSAYIMGQHTNPACLACHRRFFLLPNIPLLRSPPANSAPVLHLRSDTVTASDHVRVLGVTFSSDLSLEEACL